MKEGWTYKVFGEVCFYKKEQGKWRDMPYVGMEHIEAHTGHLLGSVSSNTMESSAFRFNKGDVLYGRLRPYLQKVVVAPFDGCCSTEIFPIQSNVLLSEYLKYWFLTIDTTDFLNKSCSGCRMPRANMNLLKLYPISYPSKDEQQRIIEYLDAEFANIDALKVNAENQLQAAKDLFQTALKELLTPKENWEKKNIEELTENLDYKRVPITKGFRQSGEYPYYGASGIVDYVNDYIFDEDILLVSEDGANLMARVTPIAFSVSGKVWVNNHAHVLRCKNKWQQKYIEYYFAQLEIDSYITGTAQPKLTQKALNNIPVILPSTCLEQQTIVNKLDSLAEKVNQLQENYKQTLVLCSDLKQALLKQTFE